MTLIVNNIKNIYIIYENKKILLYLIMLLLLKIVLE